MSAPEAPRKIFLQIGDDDNSDLSGVDWDEVTWCRDKIHDSDVEYIRADLARRPSPAEGLREETPTPGSVSLHPIWTEGETGLADVADLNMIDGLLATIREAGDRAGRAGMRSPMEEAWYRVRSLVDGSVRASNEASAQGQGKEQP